MKILIISHYYKHKNAMASVRPIKLAKYFSRAGHDVTVLTSMQKDNWCKQELTPVSSDNINEIYAPEHSGMKYLVKVYELLKKRALRNAAKNDSYSDTSGSSNATTSKNSRKIKLKQKASWLFYYTSDRLENYFLSKGLIRAAKDDNLTGFDVVIATYPGAGIHKAGEWFKKRKRTRFFIADYRDPAYNPGARANKIEARHDKHVQDMAIKYADGIVCVSHGMADSLKKQYRQESIPSVFVINNGFDSDDNKKSVPAKFNTHKFNFVYTGALYQGRRTVDMLAYVLRHIIDSGKLSKDDIAFNYAGPDFDELLSQLKPYNLESTAVDYGYVSREQSLGLQEAADAVLLLNWNDDNYTGVIPGKLYEYMSSRKPIIALIMGNRAGSESARMITECGLGCACEHAAKNDLEKLEDYILNRLTDFRNKIPSKISSDKIDTFEYVNIANKYLETIDIISKN